MRVSSNVITLGILSAVLVCAAGATWIVLEERSKREEETIRAAHPLRIVSNVTASTTLFDAQGNETSLAPYAEGWTVITSWATWCPKCGDQLATVAAVQERFAEQGVVAIAYNRTEPTRTIEAFKQTTILPTNLVYVRDTSDALYQQFEGNTMPETVIVSPEGEITHHFRGVVTEATLSQALNSLFTE